MKVAIACDHAGFELKKSVIETVQQLGHEVIDCGTYSTERVDASDYAVKATALLLKKQAERAILICGSGIAMCLTANKTRGVYASVCHDAYSARQGVEHDDMNTLCLGGRVIGSALAAVLVKEFLTAQYFNTGNYKRRVEKIKLLENQF